MSNVPSKSSSSDHTARVCNAAGDAVGLPIDQAEAMLPAGLIHDDEIVILLLRPSLLYVGLACLHSLAAIAIVALVLALAAIRVSWIPWTEVHAYAFGVALVTGRLVWQFLEWFSRVYVLTDRRIIRRMGVLRVSVFETPLRNIQHTSVFRRLRERLCGLGSIGFATAGSDTFEAFWVMIRQPYVVHRIVVETIERYGRKP